MQIVPIFHKLPGLWPLRLVFYERKVYTKLQDSNSPVIPKNKKERNGTMKKFVLSEALDVAKKLGIDFDSVSFTPEEYLYGLNIELEHGTVAPDTNVSNDDPLVTGKIALAHLNEAPFYYNDDIGLEAWEHVIETFKGDPKGKNIQIVEK